MTDKHDDGISEIVEEVIVSGDENLQEPQDKQMFDIESGAVLKSRSEKGHLNYECKDGCLKTTTTLGELVGIQFPGALANRPIGTLWEAWRAASVFVRGDIDVASKIKFWKEGAVCLDEEALVSVLRIAYDKCVDWTEFVCATDGIKKHERIDGYGFETTYDSALKKLKISLEEEVKAKRPIKDGPTGFAAPACGVFLEDGLRRGIATRVATTFRQLREVLNEWRMNKIWVVVWPLDKTFKDDEIFEIIKACDRHFEDGGRFIAVWPPVLEKNIKVWKKMSEIWMMLEQAIGNRAKPGQFFKASNAKIEDGRVFCEAADEAISWGEGRHVEKGSAKGARRSTAGQEV
ncbi:unnamed protein product [Heligmosomoides polygyrus]|uniref:DUF3854 domain-containing protein n=1 Tax=Heligmosomoides polygyrus TaxID=6339 RepID=A0A183G5M5_HELPZ|nr:unnamed protein product [Heligmosomoides polygyrus]